MVRPACSARRLSAIASRADRPIARGRKARRPPGFIRLQVADEVPSERCGDLRVFSRCLLDAVFAHEAQAQA